MKTERLRIARSLRNPALALLPLLLWAVYAWIETIKRIVRYYTPLPILDYWRVAQFLKRYRSFDLSVLWIQHNEHRIIFPEIVFAADMLLFRGRQVLPVCLSVILYAGILAILGWILHADKRLSPLMQTAAMLLAAIVMGWQGSAVFLADSFLLNWTLLQFAVTAALAFLTFAQRPAHGWYFAVSLAFAEVATFSSGNGMLLWPVLLLAALALGLPKRRIWQLAAVSVVSIGLYFVGYQLSGNLNLQNFVSHPLYSLEFLGAYVSMPFGGMKSPMFGVWVGLANISIAAALFCVAARKGLLRAPIAAVLFGIYLFDVLTALLTAAGRMDLSDAHFQIAESPRYLSVPLVNWAVLVVLLIWTSGVCGWRKLSPAKICIAVALLSLAGFPKLRWWLQDRDLVFSERQLVTIAMGDGILDPNLMLKIFPDPNFVRQLVPELRSRRLSVFGDRRYSLIGKPLSGSFGRLQHPGFGAITYVHPVVGGLEVAGWVDASHDNENASEIVLVNESGGIAGFGSKLGSLFPHRLVGLQTPPSLGWAGFVNLTVKSTSFQAFLIRKHQLVSLGGPVRVPGITVAEPENAGKTITGVEWMAQPDLAQAGWKRNGELPAGWLGEHPRGVFYTSQKHWAGTHFEGDNPKTSLLMTASVPTPADHCLVLPVLHGPSVEGVSVAVDHLAVPLQDKETTWTYFRIASDGPSTMLEISAQNPNVWIAAGEPQECRQEARAY
ncbi:MAG TPA: hypothetical protein VK604_16930 [Bryobacteraceae bacterium]|nr:hypothetical protein [Bryobacteraceae bacterium]